MPGTGDMVVTMTDSIVALDLPPFKQQETKNKDEQMSVINASKKK